MSPDSRERSTTPPKLESHENSRGPDNTPAASLLTLLSRVWPMSRRFDEVVHVRLRLFAFVIGID